MLFYRRSIKILISISKVPGESMNILDILNYYDEVKDNLEFQSTSSIRTKIMISLSEGPKKTKELEKSIGISYYTTLHGINKLEKQNLILIHGNYCYLSKVGRESVSNLIDMIKTLIVLKNNRKLLLNHDIESIPYDLLMEIGDLSDSKLIESENEDISKTHRIHSQIVLNAKKISGVSPIFYSDYIETFMPLLKKNINIELVLTENILKKTVDALDKEYLEEFKTLISKNHLRIWELKENIKVAFTVTDKAMTLGLFSKKGMYDSTKILVSDHEDALVWGNKLFKHYLKRAQKVDLNYIQELKQFN